MRALFLRFSQFTGPAGPVVVLVYVTVVPALAVMSGRAPSWVPVVGEGIAPIAIAIAAARKYSRSSKTISHEDILLPLVQSEREYCLVLRPFGRDGEIIIPKGNRKFRLARNMTMEQLIGATAHSVLGLETYSIVDQNVLFAPPGVTFIRASNDEWMVVAQRLIQRAHSIFLILPPDQDIGEGFTWEIEQIIRSGVQSRVIIMLPPYDTYAPWVFEPEHAVHAHQAALRQACGILTLLDGSSQQSELDHLTAHEYELRLSGTTLVIRYTKSGPTWWQTLPREPRRRTARRIAVTEKSYLSGLIKALNEAEQGLSGLDFKARYPV